MMEHGKLSSFKQCVEQNSGKYPDKGAFLVNALFKKDIKAITWLFQHMPALKAAVKADADEVLEMFEGRHGAFMKAKYKGAFEMYTTVKGL